MLIRKDLSLKLRRLRLLCFGHSVELRSHEFIGWRRINRERFIRVPTNDDAFSSSGQESKTKGFLHITVEFSLSYLSHNFSVLKNPAPVGGLDAFA